MSERKVLNKYYPPNFDPTQIPRLKRARNRQFSIRIMAPFNMRCAMCGEYIYKGKKFNSRQERVEDEDYLGLMIFRFYIKCPRCVSEISFKTDPQNCDYELEAGATRNFEALRTAERLAAQEVKEKEEEEKDNPMKVLENRTRASQQEMEALEALEELREMNSRHAKLDHEQVIKLHRAYEQQLRTLQDDEDEKLIRSIFGASANGESIKRIHDDDDDDDEAGSSTPKVPRTAKPSDILIQGLEIQSEVPSDSSTKVAKSASVKPKKESPTWEKSIGGLSTKKSLLGIVKKKQPTKPVESNLKNEDKVGKGDEVKNGTDSASKTLSADQPEIEIITKTAMSAPGAMVKQAGPGLGKSEGDQVEKSSVPTGLGLLGAYSDTDSEGSSG